jgi:glutamate synthase domain-containing protein 3
LLRRETPERRAASLDASALLRSRPGGFSGERQLETPGGELGERLVADARPILDEQGMLELSYPIGNHDRAVGARLGVEIGRRYGHRPPPGRVRARFEGTAGQSFGAFLSAGAELELVGEANDYVGKGMSGGRLVVLPPPHDAGDPILLGNAVLYGATGGELFCRGRAGERFAVRNSGATAVVEGAGDHACEYMTGGTVVMLGEVGLNVAAGMSGGELYVLDEHGRLPLRLNAGLVAATRAGGEGLRALLERHLGHTGSTRAAAVLERWDEAEPLFWRVVPRMLEGAAVHDALQPASP